jgi:hypothetical protein
MQNLPIPHFSKGGRGGFVREFVSQVDRSVVELVSVLVEKSP